MRTSWRLVAVSVVGVVAAAMLVGQWGDRPIGLPCASAQPNVAPARSLPINTSGTATVNVKPDSARVFFSVTKRGQELAEVRAENVKSANQVMERLGELGIKRIFTKTSTMNVQIIWDPKDSTRIQGYGMANAFTVRVVDTDVEQLARDAARVVDVALAAGANEIEQITFFKEDDSVERRECLKKAVEAARANAEAIAEAAAVSLTGPLAISVRPESPHWSPAMNNVQVAGPMGGSDTASSFTPGDVQIKCTADVCYGFAPE